MEPKDRVKRGVRNVSHVTSATSLVVNGVVNAFQAAVNPRPALVPCIVAEWPVSNVGTEDVKNSLPQISNFTLECLLSQVVLRGCGTFPWPADS